MGRAEDEHHEEEEEHHEELPLKFEDIVDTETYDKMRPPRPGGELRTGTEMRTDAILSGDWFWFGWSPKIRV